ncbi:FAD-dependent monooxygenase [Actinomadura algeriensis]|uniref:2-polyprenyl-6-methoxyphenol hydroxylase-like FAD-dependent oxidoreductase n=1 Tax=Actinomadura algeriensis TaxID=1679523 RepID=A0ABR9JNJ8_9ACTN|nr:FAD-dependent monooxygenase [Actinomadura algeriensis]MBE1532127.1 2-polyprenyl-6-methoxyphenol hydroxylase-like FAD-dependent oxidoreductase [Actinomadura algeriensis]
MGELRTAIVVGAGIAGLASAVSLARAGWTVAVLERAEAFGEVGAGLAITRNGMAALDALDVGEAVRAAGWRTVSAGIQDPAGRWLVRMPDTAQVQATTTIWGVHRRRLHAALLRAAEDADGVELVTGAEVTDLRPGHPGGAAATVSWRGADGTGTREAGLVVAADGVRSVVRERLFPGIRARYSGSTSWRAVVADTDFDGRLVQVWGPGAEFGAVRISEQEIYWYGYFRHGQGAVFEDEAAAAGRRFAGYPSWARTLVAATAEDRLMRHDVHYLPDALSTYARGRVVMVGDAAHAMLPTSGQGASSALEDGICVGRLIGAPVAGGAHLADALAAFDRARRPRCRQLARISAVTARFGADLGDGWRQPVRNALLRLTPGAVLGRAGGSIVGWTAP